MCLQCSTNKTLPLYSAGLPRNSTDVSFNLCHVWQPSASYQLRGNHHVHVASTKLLHYTTITPPAHISQIYVRRDAFCTTNCILNSSRVIHHSWVTSLRLCSKLMPRRSWPYSRTPLSYNWPKLERDITNRMNMFKSYLSSLPKNRLDYVEDLDIPDITLSPYVWTYPEDYYYLRRGSYLSDCLTEYDKATLSTDSSIPLSRAMTDSEIDYEFYKRVICIL